MENDLLTLEEMANRLKVKVSWLYRKTKENGTEAIPRLMVGKYIRFNEAEVMEWLRRKQNEK